MSTESIEKLKQEVAIAEAMFDTCSESFEVIRVAYEDAREQLESLLNARNDATAALLAAIQKELEQ